MQLQKMKDEQFGFEKDPNLLNASIFIQNVTKVNKIKNLCF